VSVTTRWTRYRLHSIIEPGLAASGIWRGLPLAAEDGKRVTIFSKIAYYAKAYYESHMARRVVVSYMPEYVAVEVTNVCNFRCSFCPQSDPDHHTHVPRTYLDEETCALFLKKIRDAGVQTNLMHWTLDGEPFMHKGFDKLCRVGAEYGFTNAYFGTNGTLCTPDRLLQLPLDKCRFNLAIDYCADPDYFESVRGGRDSWERVKTNVAAILSDERFRNVYVDITDISSFSVTDEAELRERFASLKALFGEHRRIGYRTRTFHNATGFLSSLRKEGRYHLCPYPWTTLRVAANGDIVACCRDLRHKTVLGNLKTEDLPQIWNGAPMQELRQALLDGKPERAAACKDCDLPYDDSKFTVRNMMRAAKGRIQLFTSAK